MSSQSGFLVAADVSGYTEFLTGSELDHAHDIMRGLMKVLTRALGHPLRLVKYEGDAVLCYAPDDAARGDAILLDVIEGTYVAFSDHVFNMKSCTSCTCKACFNMARLDLKLFVHHGSFIAERGNAGLDLSGPDVILLHRLMKNHVRERTSIDAYLLMTSAALDRMGRPTGFMDHVEHYEHFGDIQCGVSDLRAALAQRRDAREVRVSRADAQVLVEGTVSAAPSAVWDYYFDPVKRLAWDQSLTRMTRKQNGRGREGIGATMHCAHGSFTTVGTTLDWKPFRYFTQEYVPQGAGLAPAVLVTVETEALPDGTTRVTQLARASSSNPVHRALVALTKGKHTREGVEGLRRLADVIAATPNAPAPN